MVVDATLPAMVPIPRAIVTLHTAPVDIHTRMHRRLARQQAVHITRLQRVQLLLEVGFTLRRVARAPGDTRFIRLHLVLVPINKR